MVEFRDLNVLEMVTYTDYVNKQASKGWYLTKANRYFQVFSKDEKVGTYVLEYLGDTSGSHKDFKAYIGSFNGNIIHHVGKLYLVFYPVAVVRDDVNNQQRSRYLRFCAWEQLVFSILALGLFLYLTGGVAYNEYWLLTIPLMLMYAMQSVVSLTNGQYLSLKYATLIRWGLCLGLLILLLK